MLPHSLDLLQKLELFFEFKVVNPGNQVAPEPKPPEGNIFVAVAMQADGEPYR